MASAGGGSGELARWLVRRAAPCDAEAACAFGRARFIDTFGHLYSEADLTTYLAESYTVDVFAAWLADPLMCMWLAQDPAGALLGYALAGPPTVPHADVAPGDGELRKLYLCEAAKGSGIARALLGPAVAWVRAGGCASAGTPLPAGGARAWLNVWSENSRAIRFYEREGFAVVGEFEYCVGEARDRELIMRLGEGAPAPALAPAPAPPAPTPTPAGTSGGSGNGSRHVFAPALQLARAALALLLLVATVAAAAAAPCTSDEGCSLSGVCGAGGVCACDAGWRGDSCGELAVVAGSAALGYHNASWGVGASWGANAVFADGVWHAFVAEMTHNCTLNDYGSNSRIIRVTSTAGPAGPYAFAAVVVAPYAHNPTVRELPDGSFALFMIGGTPAVERNCSGSPVAAGPAHARATDDPSGISVSWAPRVTGPWSPPRRVEFSHFNGTQLNCSFTNPSPHVLANGSVLLAFQGGYCHSVISGVGEENIGVALALRWDGVYALVTGAPIVEPPPWCVAGLGEDPFLWQNAAGHYHMLIHGMCFAPFNALHTYSRDGVSWALASAAPYSYAVNYTDAAAALYWRVERPQLAFGADGAPTVLFNGVCGDGLACLESPGKTWTLARPLTAK